MNLEIKVGDKFGKLTIVGNYISKNGRYWPCKCSCGGELLVSVTNLINRAKKNGGCSNCYRFKHRHGSSKNPTYSKYQAMKQRCTNPNHKDYFNYGGRGISVCERWINSFENFLEDMGKCPVGFSIERINTNGNYEPNNCKWATKLEQARNTRRTKQIVIDGRTFSTLSEACEFYETPYSVVRARLARGNDLEVSLKAPLMTGFKGKGLWL